jgi:hypothetical protein
MSTFDDFRPGDLVAHIANGDGTVESVTETVNVVYLRKDRRGQAIRNSYDRQWFILNPRFLFHRTAP